MKVFIVFSLLFMALSITPKPVLAVVHIQSSVYLRTNYKTETETLRPKWIKTLEWMVPIFLILGIILFVSSFNLSLWAPMIVRPLNHTLALVSFAIAASSAITLFAFRMIKLLRKHK